MTEMHNKSSIPKSGNFLAPWSGASASPATRLQVTPDCLMVPAKSMIPSGTTGAITLVVSV
jgi:hypothetical protein